MQVNLRTRVVKMIGAVLAEAIVHSQKIAYDIQQRFPYISSTFECNFSTIGTAFGRSGH